MDNHGKHYLKYKNIKEKQMLTESICYRIEYKLHSIKCVFKSSVFSYVKVKPVVLSCKFINLYIFIHLLLMKIKQDKLCKILEDWLSHSIYLINVKYLIKLIYNDWWFGAYILIFLMPSMAEILKYTYIYVTYVYIYPFIFSIILS